MGNNPENDTNNSTNHDALIYMGISQGANLIGGIVQTICNSVNKSKDSEIEKLKMEKEELIQKEREKIERKENLRLELQNKINEFYENKIIKFQIDENEFKDNEIKNLFPENLLNTEFSKLKVNNDFIKMVDDKIKESILKLKSKLKVSKTLNIYLMGNTGVGKTCLKNVICDKLYSEERFGSRGTTVRQRFTCDCHKYLSFTDNIGFELAGIYSIQNLLLDTQNYIMETIKSNEEAIHCLWYCLTGTRFQEAEYEVICNLRKIYKEKNIPIIIIYTQAIEKEKIKEMKVEINEKLRNQNNEEIGEEPENIQFIPLLAKKVEVFNDIIIPPYNLSKLMEKTYNAYEYSVDLVNKKCLIELIKESVKKEYDNKLISYLDILEQNKISENFFDYILGDLFGQFLNFNYIKTCFSELKFIKEKILSFAKQKYKLFKEEKELKIFDDIKKIQEDFCSNNSNEDINLFSIMKSEIELKTEISNRFDAKNEEDYKLYALDKISKIFLNYLANELSKKILTFFEDEIENEKLKNEIDIASKINNNSIKEGIKKIVDELKIKESKNK